MMLLVVLTLISDNQADPRIVIGAAVLSTFGLTVLAIVAWRTAFLGSWWFVTLDGVIALVVGAASTMAGAEELFHGGYPMSWIVLAAYAGGRLASLSAAALVTVEQVAVHLADGRGEVPTGGNVIFFVFAFLVGWTFDALRTSDAARRAAVFELEQERVAAARREERVHLADRLHDTLQQSVHAITLHADDADQVRRLAREQERLLRRALAALQSEHELSVRVALLEARDDVETMYDVDVTVVLRFDAAMDEKLQILVDSAREAMLNSAHYSGVETIHLYSDLSDGFATVSVVDRGVGFDTSTLTPHRGLGRFRQRLEDIGGELTINSDEVSGTRCDLRVPAP